MEKEQLLKMQETLQKSINEGLEAVKSSFGEQLKKSQDELSASQKQLEEIKEKLAKLESLPVKRVGAPAIVGSNKYKGYNLNHQGQSIRGKMSTLRTLNNEESVNEFSKFMIDVMKASALQDMQAKQDLHEFYKNYAAKATMDAGTNAEGGYLVPDEFAFDIVDIGRDRTFALNQCTVVPMSSDTLKLPTELTLASVNWVAEAAQMTQGEPTFGQVTLTTKDLTGYAIATNQLLRDSAIDVVSLLTEQFSYGTLLELDNQVLNGTGSPVSGVLTAAAGKSVVMATGLSNFSSISFGNINEMISLIPAGLDYNLTMIFNKSIKRFLRDVKDSNNRYILNDPGAITPGTVWEVPYITSSKGPSSTGASTAFVVVGNFKYFYIGRRIGSMRIDVDPYGRFDYNETRFRMVTAWGLNIAQANAFCRLVTAA